MSRASTWARGVWNAYLKQDSLIESEVEQRFILLSFGWNCAEYVREHMQSIEQQRYDNYIHVVVDDGSTDSTYNEIMSHKHAKVMAHRNDTRVGWLRNSILYVDRYIQRDEDILLQVDLDDRLAHPKVLSHLNGLFAQEDLWVVHGGRGWPRSILRDRSFRSHDKWGRFIHPRAFLAFLWKAIDKEDFKGPDGQYALSAQDRALYYPVLEMTPPHKLRSTETQLYLYNKKHSILGSKDESQIRQQADNTQWFRSKRPYPILKRDSLFCRYTRDMKKVALLTARPNEERPLSVREKRPPHGIGFLYSILRNEKDLQVEIFDYYSGERRWPRDDFASYDVVGIYCASVCTDGISEILSRARSRRIVVGGPHAHLRPDWFGEKVSHIVRGEAEHLILDLVHHPDTFPRIISTPRLSNCELDELPRFPFDYFCQWPRRRRYVWDFDFDKTKPVFTLNTSRGCPFNCSFCSVKKIWGRKITFMSSERILDDLSYVKSLGARGIYFREDNFTVNKRRVVELCEAMIKRGMNLKWACETRVDTVDDEMMGLMARAGCLGFYVGVEHLSQRMLDVFNKGVTVDQIVRFFQTAHHYGIKTAASLIVDHPSETPADRTERERLLEVIRPTLQWRNPYRPEG